MSRIGLARWFRVNRTTTLLISLVTSVLILSITSVPSVAQPQSSKGGTDPETADLQKGQTETASGVFSVMYGDPKPGSNVKTEPGYTLTDDQGDQTELLLDESLAKSSGGPLAFNGKRVEVTGTPVPDEPEKLEVRSIGFERTQDAERAAARIEAGKPAAEPVVSGSRPWVTIGCRFADSTSITPKDRAWFETEMGGAEPGLDHFWRQLSYNNLDLTGSQVAVWYNLPQPRSFYLTDPQTHFQGHTLNFQRIAQDCTAAANQDVFFPNFEGINMVFNQDLDCCSWGGPATLNLDGQTKTYAMTYMATWGYGNQNVLAQEMGHGFGLPHSSGPYNTPYDSKWDPMSGGGTCSPPHAEYGCLGNHTVAFHKELMGWLPASQIYRAGSGSNQNITLERIGSTASGNYLMAKIPIGGSTTNFYTLEARRFVGYDGQIPGEAVVIHKVDTTRGDRQAQVVDPDNNGNPNDASAMWTPGETFTDSVNGIRVRVNQATTNGYSITISPSDTTPPANDNFSNAQSLSGTSATVTGSNAGATKEAGEPNHAGFAGGKSVWYRWTPQASGTVNIDTAGSGFDTLLAVYTGGAVNALTEVASNDDANGGGDGVRTSKVSNVPVTAGTTYRIAVDGYNGAAGGIALNLAQEAAADTEDPTVTLTAPAEGAPVSGANVTFSANAADNVGVTKVEFLVDGAVVGTDTTATGNSFSVNWDSTATPDGRSTVTARAYDAADNDDAASYEVVVDNTYPDTRITGGPAEGSTTSQTTASFSFDNPTAERDVTFVCSLDGAAYAACLSPKSYQNLSVGQHTFSVKAVGAAGEAVDSDPTPATRTWTVQTSGDTTAPTIASSVPVPNRTKIRRTSNVAATFSEAMRTSTLTPDNVQLYANGAGSPIAATVTLSADGKSVTLDPAATLARKTKYLVVLWRDDQGVKDAAGNPLAASGAYRQSDNGQYVYFWFTTGKK